MVVVGLVLFGVDCVFDSFLGFLFGCGVGIIYILGGFLRWVGGSVVLALLVLSLWFLVLYLCGEFSCVGSVCLGLILSGVWVGC